MRLLLGLLTLCGLFASASGEETKEIPPEEPESKAKLALDLGGHTSGITNAWFTPDSEELITLSNDQTIRFWDGSTGQSRRVLYPPGQIVGAQSRVSPDGKRLAVPRIYETGKDKKVFAILLISLPEGRLERTLHGPSTSVPTLAFSPDGKRLASGSANKMICIWNLDKEEDKPEQTFTTPVPPRGLAFSPDGKRLVQSGEYVGIFDVEKGKSVALFQGGGGDKVAWSPDGKTIAFATAAGLRLWDAEPEGKQIAHLQAKVKFCSVDFTSDSQTLLGVTAEPGKVILFDATTGEPRQTFVGGERCYEGALSPDGKSVVAVGQVGSVHEVLFWQTADPKQVRHLKGRTWLNFPAQVGWSADPKPGAPKGIFDARAVAWKRRDDPWEKGRTFRLEDLTFGKSSGRIDAAGAEVLHQKVGARLQELRRDGSTVMIAENRRQRATITVNFPVSNASFFGPERVLLSGSGLRLFDASNGKQVGTLPGHRSYVESISCSPDRKYLASISHDQVLCIHTQPAGHLLMSLFVAGNEWIVWTPQGYYAATPGGEKLMGWVVDNGPNEMHQFHPASRFRAKLYRPDVIKLLLQEGDVHKAVKIADEKLIKEGKLKVSKEVEVSDVLPPRVVVTTSAQPGTAVKDGKLKIEAVATAQGADPITGLQLLIDDRPYVGEGGQITLKEPQKGPVKQTWEVTLPPGAHDVRVLARTGASLGTSRGMAVLSEEKAGVKKELPTLYVLAVGIDAYREKGLQLKGAVNDATKLEKVFEKHSAGLFAKVEHVVVTDKDATMNGMLKGLDWLKEKMKPNDVAVFFYAGHGGLEKGEFYLLPQDVKSEDLNKTGLSRVEIKKRMQAMPGRILVLLDACHSAAIGLLFDDMSRELQDEDCGVVVMCAARPKEVALEKGGHGHLTRSVIDGLSGKASTSPRDKCVYLHHLQQYVIDSVEELSKDTQHPTAVVPPWMRPFALSKPGTEPAPETPAPPK